MVEDLGLDLEGSANNFHNIKCLRSRVRELKSESLFQDSDSTHWNHQAAPQSF